MKRLITKIITLLILIYQNTLSLIFPSTCRFSPSCSHYMSLSVKKYGPLKGINMGIKQILKCHPWSKSNSWDPIL